MEKISYVTVFDSRYLIYGLSLYRSLLESSIEKNFILNIICIDKKLFNSLTKLNLSNVQLYNLYDIQTEDIILARNNRNYTEFCWTLSSFAIDFILNNTDSKYLIYLDADLYILNDPIKLIDKNFDVLITPHDFDSDYNDLIIYGKYCVQLMIIKRNNYTKRLIKEWHEKVINWCYCIVEENRFGDQKYLNTWINDYPELTIYESIGKTLGPWNLNKYKNNLNNIISYHFHSSKIFYKLFIPIDGYSITDVYFFKLYALELTKIKYFLVLNQIKIDYKKYSFRNIVGILKRYLFQKVKIYII